MGTSIAIFGSVVRKDFDYLSDKDILIVTDNPLMIKKYVASLEHLNWSCALYSWSRFNKLIEKKALFIEHIKDESKIILDENNQLRELLDNFSPKVDYSNEIIETHHLIKLLENIPNSNKGSGWALDILMIAFRNYSISTLANEGIYKFSFYELLYYLVKLNYISSDEACSLQQLRLYKKAYRNNIDSLVPTHQTLFNLIKIVDRAFKIGFHAKRVNNQKLFDNFLNEKYWEKSTSYYNLRKLEACNIALANDIAFIKSPDYYAYHINLNRRIEDPRTYSWEFEKNNTCHLHKFLQILNN